MRLITRSQSAIRSKASEEKLEATSKEKLIGEEKAAEKARLKAEFERAFGKKDKILRDESDSQLEDTLTPNTTVVEITTSTPIKTVKDLKEGVEENDPASREPIDSESDSILTLDGPKQIYPDLDKLILEEDWNLQKPPPLEIEFKPGGTPPPVDNLKIDPIKSKMANKTVALKDAVKVVPEFDGRNIPLTTFIQGSKEALAMIEPDSEANLAKLIRSRIIGEARETITGETFYTIKELNEFFKSIYFPAKTVHQLMGELGASYQSDNESIILYANRMRDIGTRIIEAKRMETGRDDEAFKTVTRTNIIECFKRGLKSEIEQRLGETPGITTLVANAIKIERQLEAQGALRKTNPTKSENTPARRVNACQTCQSPNHKTDRCDKKPIEQCEYCKKTGHTQNDCFKRARDYSCQLCSKPGHTASQCYMQREKCQLCKRSGHTAQNCRQNSNYRFAYQLCGKQEHSSKDCQPVRVNNITQLKCQLCNKFGHVAVNCNTMAPARSNTITCFYCTKPGHMISECRKLEFNNKNAQETNHLLCELVPLD